jgi:hypothetical protein
VFTERSSKKGLMMANVKPSSLPKYIFKKFAFVVYDYTVKSVLIIIIIIIGKDTISFMQGIYTYIPETIHVPYIIIIIIGKDTISFMVGIYTYIPETNHVPKYVCSAQYSSFL